MEVTLIDSVTTINESDSNGHQLDVQAIRDTLQIGSTSTDGTDYYHCIDQYNKEKEAAAEGHDNNNNIIHVDSTTIDHHHADTNLDDSTNSLTNRVKNLRKNEGHKKREALYCDGATPLFKAIEEVNWREALRIAEKHPDQIRIWVKSTGTEGTTFDWSFWRRLPIHEASRRQAPAWFVSTLLSHYPESACEVTQFNELPLHLAVGCGAAPEVVNLILVSNWEGIVSRDNSGRTPLEIWSECDLLVHDDRRVVYESLTRCYNQYTNTQMDWKNKMQTMKKQHELTVIALGQQHDDQISDERGRQRELEMEINDLYDNIEKLTKDLRAREEKIASFAQVEKSWYERVESLNQHVALLQMEKKEEQENVDALHQIIKQKDSELSATKGREMALSNDMLQIGDWYSATDEQLVRTQRHLQKMVDSYVHLHEKLMDEKETVHKKIQSRNIKPSKMSSSQKPPSSTSSNKPISDEGKDFDADEVANAAASGAIAALQK